MKHWKYVSLAALFVFMMIIGMQAGAIEMQFAIETKGAQAVKERLKIDLAVVKASIGETKLDDSERQALLKRAQELTAQVDALPNELPTDFRTIMPFNDLQASIFALNAPVLRAKGFPKLSAWTQNRWDPLFPLQSPATPSSEPRLEVAMMRNEYRAEAFNLTNATDTPMTARITLSSIPDGGNPSWISVREVMFTDTYVHYPIAAALPEAKKTSGGYEISIPAGMTRQVWLTFHPTKENAVARNYMVSVSTTGIQPISIPLQVRLFPFDFPSKQKIAIGGWDYTNRNETAYDGKIVDQKAFIKFLRDYGVDTPWATSTAMTGCEFDADGRMTKAPDFTEWDSWVAKWKGARYYAVYFGVTSDFYGEKMGTPRFNRMVGEWITSLVDHAKGQGIKPNQILALLVDEPHKPEHDAVHIPWAQAVKAAQPEVVIWNDPVYEDPGTADKRLFETSDVLCPMLTRFIGLPQSYRDFFVAQQSAGRDLWLYACVNGKHLDPISYHRGQFWMAIKYKAKGSCYWAFCDEGGSGSSFKAYSSPGHMFSPIFIDPQMGIIDGKHMQAIREGAEDYEYFQMLQKRVSALESRGMRSPLLDAANKLLVDGPERVMRDISVANIGWMAEKDRSVMDQVRIEVLESLQSLSLLR